MTWALLYSLLIVRVFANCMDDGINHPEDDKWIRNGNFLVACKNAEIKVLKCVTDGGTVLELGTERYEENGVEYSCVDDKPEEGSGETPPSVSVCGDFADASDDLVIDNFLICCMSRRFKGCVDDKGDSLKRGYFVVGKGLLKFCNIMNQGWKARIEPKGCFNGTADDDVEDPKFHVKKYAVWRIGDVDYRCGDNGIHVHRCYVDGKAVYTGYAWIGKDEIVHVCK